MSKTIFLSTVNSEFRAVRSRLAAIAFRLKRLQVRHEQDFIQRGVLTLETLEIEIRQSDLVVHLIGAEPGSVPPLEQVEALLNRLPDFAAQFPDVAAAARQQQVTYTHWEAWLGLYFANRPGRAPRLCSFAVAGSPADPHPLQSAHLDRLRRLQRFPKNVPAGTDPVDEVLVTLIDLGYLSPQEVFRPIVLPYLSLESLFKGRDLVLDQLRASLSKPANWISAIIGKAVHGLGGVGKTRLAVEFAWRHADDYSAVLFVVADSPDSLRRNLAALTVPLALHLAEHEAKKEEHRVAATLRWLTQHPGWLLILDNADTDPAAAEVDALLPRLHGGQVLITSRLNRWHGAVQSLELDTLASAAAAEFLLLRTQPSGRRGRKVAADDDRDAATLADELGGLALALEQAAAYVVARRKSLAEYLLLWRQHDARVQTWHDPRAMKYPRSIAVTWQTTLDELSDDERTLLNVLAWFSPDPLPVSVLSAISASLRSKEEDGNAENAEGAEKSDEPWDQDRVESALAVLSDFSLIHWDPAAGTVSVHRVLQEILRTRQDQPRTFLSAALNLLNAALPAGNPADVRTWPA